MNTAERLIKVATDIRIAEIHREPTGVPTREVPESRLPSVLRVALRRRVELHKQLEKINADIQAAGFEVPYETTSLATELMRARKPIEVQQQEYSRKRQIRLERCKALRNDASIAVLGLSATAAQPIVKKFVASLAKV